MHVGALEGCCRLHNAAALVQLRRSQAALRVLETSRDARGRRFEIIRLPLPPPLHYKASEVPTAGGAAGRATGQRLAASYVNFYICNGGVIMPAFDGDASQTDAECATFELLFIDFQALHRGRMVFKKVGIDHAGPDKSLSECLLDEKWSRSRQPGTSCWAGATFIASHSSSRQLLSSNIQLPFNRCWDNQGSGGRSAAFYHCAGGFSGIDYQEDYG